MAWTKQQKQYAIAVLVVVIIVIVGFFGWHYWTKHHKKGAFHGWRHQHYEDNPYNGQQYRCGMPQKRLDRFTGDLDHWPSAGVFGNLADTNPYGNYAGHADMYYPTYFAGDANMYYTRT